SGTDHKEQMSLRFADASGIQTTDHPTHDTTEYSDLGQKATVAPANIDPGAPLSLSIAPPAVTTTPDNTATIVEDATTPVVFDVLANDVNNLNSNKLELRSVSTAVGGTVTIVNPSDKTDGRVSFLPTHDFAGTATFTYTTGIVGNTTNFTGSASVTVT